MSCWKIQVKVMAWMLLVLAWFWKEQAPPTSPDHVVHVAAVAVVLGKGRRESSCGSAGEGWVFTELSHFFSRYISL